MQHGLAIGKDLNLDVTDAGEVFLHIHGAVAEGGLGFACGSLEIRGKIRFTFNDPHAASATTGHRLEKHRVAKFSGDLHGRLG